MREDINERLDDWYNEMLKCGYTKEEIDSAIELKYYAAKDNNTDSDEG